MFWSKKYTSLGVNSGISLCDFVFKAKSFLPLQMLCFEYSIRFIDYKFFRSGLFFRVFSNVKVLQKLQLKSKKNLGRSSAVAGNKIGLNFLLLAWKGTKVKELGKKENLF